MKTFLRILACCTLILFFACKDNPKKAEKEEEMTSEVSVEETETSTIESKPVTDCDEFIDEYDGWMESYLTLLEKYKDNPAALVGTKEYNDMTMRSLEWASQGTQLAIDCATDSSYDKRMKEIQEKAEKKMKELGFN